MGAVLSFTKGLFTSKKQTRIHIYGLGGAGKSTMLFKFKIGQFYTSPPYRGYSVEVSESKKLVLVAWDLPVPHGARRYWRECHRAEGLIFVVDSSDRERIAEAQKELSILLAEDGLRNAVLLVFANKQDLPNAMTISEITEKLGLSDLKDRKWHIQGTCATSSDGLYEGLEWMSQQSGL